MSKRPRGDGRIFLRGTTYWIDYRAHGRRIRESTHSEDLKVAQRLLRQRLGAVRAGQLVTPDADRLTFDALWTLVEEDYRLQGRRSAKRLVVARPHLQAFFGAARMARVKSPDLVRYANSRLAEGAAKATVRYELAILRRAYRLATRAGLLASRPEFPTIQVQNARTGFFERPELDAVLAALPEPLRPVVLSAYCTGWRLNELLGLTWDRVDLEHGTLKLLTSKNGEPRVFPIDPFPELRELLHRQRAYTSLLETAIGHPIPWVFHRNGRPIRNLYTAWRTACTHAGVPGRLMHDFRRTAVRNLERAGVARSVAMKLTGHKTESIYRRYAIVAEQDLREGVAKLAEQHAKDFSRTSP